MNRTQLFNEAWQLMVRNSALWIVALILLALGAIIGLVLNSSNVAMVIINTLISLALSAFLTGALISMVNAIADGRTQTVNDGLQAGAQKIVPLVLLRLLLTVPLWIIAFLLSGSLLVALSSAVGRSDGFSASNFTSLMSGGVAGMVGMGLALTIVSIAVAAVGVGAERAIVIEDAPVIDAVKRGWNLVAVHLGDFLVIGLLMIVIGLAIGILVGCAVGAVAVPTAIGQLGADGTFNPGGFGATVLITALIGVAVGVVTQVLFSAVWTLAYRQWQGK